MNTPSTTTGRPKGIARLGLGALVALSLVAASPAARAAGASLDTATKAQKKTAGEKFGTGMKAFDGKKYDDALAAFRASYDGVASPNSHLMIARTLVKLGRLGEAYEEFDKTEHEAEAAASVDKKYKKAAKSAADERDALREKIALVTVQVSDAKSDDELTVADRKIDREDWTNPVAVDPGSIKVVLRSSDGHTTEKQVQADAGGTASVEIAPEAPKPAVTNTETHAEAKPSTSGGGVNKRTLAYIAGGVGAAGLVTFGVFGILNNSKYSSLKDSCPNNSCPADRKSAADTGRTYQTVANVGLVVGIVGLAGGATLYFLSVGDEKKDKKAERAGPEPKVAVGLGFGSVNVRGSF